MKCFIENIIAFLRSNLKENFYYSTREWQYKNIEPRIVVEELLSTENGEIPNDYKCHCFNGKLAFVHVDISRFGDRRRNLYDTNWDLIPCVWQYENGELEEKPELFDKMRSLAETIAQDFIYARVDFYLVKGHIFFGEISLLFDLKVEVVARPGVLKTNEKSWKKSFF